MFVVEQKNENSPNAFHRDLDSEWPFSDWLYTSTYHSSKIVLKSNGSSRHIPRQTEKLFRWFVPAVVEMILADSLYKCAFMSTGSLSDVTFDFTTEL